jgi:NAD(P)-dependent dehydrogenase (short-subunit alcohol dehydrogenase family)
MREEDKTQIFSPNNQRFAGKTVIVTGAGGGLGEAVVNRLVLEGATVFAPMIENRDQEWLVHDRVIVKTGIDANDENSMMEYYSSFLTWSRGPWASIHLVGGYTKAPVIETTMADFDRMMSLNARSCFLACREAARSMRAPGRIVNVTARPAVVPTSMLSAYAASKAAVSSITQNLSEELREHGIFVNAVIPSIIDTPANRKAMPAEDFSRWPKGHEVADAIAFLASPENKLISGALVPVYGRM